MIAEIPVLSLLIFVPTIGAVLILVCAQGDDSTIATNSRWGALWASTSNFFLSLWLLLNFDKSTAEFQFLEKVEWIPQFGISYNLGVDGISLLFILLTTLLTPICIVASWENIQHKVKEYMISFLILESFMIGMFCALDIIIFYIFFEAVLIPMFLIIGVWGGVNRVYAAFKLFLYTLLGSVLMLLAMIAIYIDAGTTSIPSLLAHNFEPTLQPWLWLGLMASFAVKVPMWPVHTWLPDAHVEAPTAGSVILAGILLKFGGYGFLRFSLPMLPEASVMFTPLIFSLSVIAVIYTSLIALAQTDLKKLVAYSSIAHMGLVTAGTFTFTIQGLEGAVFQMLSHGVVSAALFLIVGVIYDRTKTRDIENFGGLAKRMPVYSAIFMLFTLSSVGLPGTSGFVGEILILIGLFKINTWIASLAATGIILSAAYMLFLYRRVIFGALSKKSLENIKDVNLREFAIFVPLIILTIFMGINPSYFLDFIHVSVVNLVGQVETSLNFNSQNTWVFNIGP